MRGVREAALLVVGLGVVALLARRFGLVDAARALRQAAPGHLLIYAGLVGSAIVGHCLRWRVVARALGANPPLGRLVQARLAGDAVGSLIPSAKIAGEPVRFALANARGGDAPRTAAGVTIDRLLEATGNLLCILAYATVLAQLHSATAAPGGTRRWIIAALFLLLAVVSLFELARRGVRPLAPLYGPAARRRFPRRVPWMDGVRRADDHLLHFFNDHRRAFAWGVLGSILIQGVVILQYRYLLRSFSIELDLPTLLMVIVTGGLARAAPTPAGLGALEAGQVALFEVTSGRGELGFVVGLVMRLHELLWTGIGLIVLAVHGSSPGRARRLMRSMEAQR